MNKEQPTREELINHIFELSFALDSQSAAKDYSSLRVTHYNNLQWIYDNGLDKEYYKYFLSELQGVQGE